MTSKKGACRFCGQMKLIDVPDTATQEEIDEEVTLECKCREARAYQEKKEAEERIEEQKVSAMGTTFELFHNDFPDVENMLNNCIPLLVTKKIKKATINTGTKVTAAISIQRGTIKVERIEKAVYTRETELA